MKVTKAPLSTFYKLIYPDVAISDPCGGTSKPLQSRIFRKVKGYRRPHLR
jgi:hypothetical protein